MLELLLSRSIMDLHSCNAIMIKYLGTPFSQSKGPDFEH